ncbi:MAG: NUDIX domain-containing protein [Saccharospirillum sp.]|nr:NUDIX domain-containing protein [Saccharospirillum sp.]
MEPYPHLTVAVLVTDNDNRILMVNEMEDGRSVWNQPAGHVEYGEDLKQAAIREALEETRHEVRLTGLLGIYQTRNLAANRHYVRLCFHAESLGLVEKATLDTDIIEARWLNIDDILAGKYPLRHPTVQQCLVDFRNGQCFPMQCLSPFSS